MSSALAAAKKRRAFGEPTNNIVSTKQPSEPKPTQNDKPMTINQAFKNMSERVNVLESKMNNNVGVPEGLVEEYEERFELILNEIVNIKDTLLKLQTFSMEVNKSLHDERIKMLSGIDTPPYITEIDNIEQVFDGSDNVIRQLSKQETQTNDNTNDNTNEDKNTPEDSVDEESLEEN